MRLIRWLFILPLLFVAIVHLYITTPIEEYAEYIEDAYQNWGFSKEGGWRMWRATRWYMGRFQSSPSDEEMIEYLNKNRAEFDALVASYYEAMKPQGSEKHHNETLVHERMKLGIDSFGMSGPALRDANAGSFYNFGVSFSLLDSGPTPWWSIGRQTYKGYHYVPEESLSTKGRKMTPTANMLATGEYILGGSSDVKLRNDLLSRCLLRQLDRNWFISRCVKY